MLAWTLLADGADPFVLFCPRRDTFVNSMLNGIFSTSTIKRYICVNDPRAVRANEEVGCSFTAGLLRSALLMESSTPLEAAADSSATIKLTTSLCLKNVRSI